MKTPKNNGFTLIELIVVLAVLAILAAVSVPSLSAIIERSKISTDQANLTILNQMTKAYSTNENLSPDIFAGISDDAQRMQVLVDKKFLTEIMVPLIENTSFKWDIDTQKWLNTYVD